MLAKKILFRFVIRRLSKLKKNFFLAITKTSTLAGEAGVWHRIVWSLKIKLMLRLFILNKVAALISLFGIV